MFFKKKSQGFKSTNYKMADSFITDNLVVANLEYVSNEATPYGPMVKQTEQKYLFEVLFENGKKRYREVFTGFIAEDCGSNFFWLPHVINVVSLKDQVSSIADSVSKYGLLLVLNEVNTSKVLKK